MLPLLDTSQTADEEDEEISSPRRRQYAAKTFNSLSSSASLSSSSDLIPQRLGYNDLLPNRIMENFEKYIQKYMIPETVSIPLASRPPEEQTKNLQTILANKRKQNNLLHGQHDAYTVQYKLYMHLIQRAAYIKQMALDINEMHEQILQLRSRLGDSSISPAQYRETDRSLTMAEHLYSELYSNHQRAIEDHKKMTQDFDNGITNLSKITREYTEIEEDNRAKRTKFGHISAEDLEQHTFSSILEERQRFEQKLKALQQLHEPYQCSICTDQGSTHILPCCQHLICKTCIHKLIPASEQAFSCPYCRQKDIILSRVIQINF